MVSNVAEPIMLDSFLWRYPINWVAFETFMDQVDTVITDTFKLRNIQLILFIYYVFKSIL